MFTASRYWSPCDVPGAGEGKKCTGNNWDDVMKLPLAGHVGRWCILSAGGNDCQKYS